MTNPQSRRIWAFALALAVLSIAQLAAQIPPKISLVERATRYHPSGADALSRFITNHMGGVLSQGMFDPSGQATLFEGAYLALPDGADDHFCIMVNDGSECLRYDIEYSELVPMVMWVGSGATSAFTAVFDVHDEEFQRDAGFAPVRSEDLRKSMAAIEFVGTPFEQILHYLDFCQACTAPSDTDLVNRYNERLSDDPAWQEVLMGLSLPRDWESTYINTDLDAVLAPSIDGGALTLTGQPARYGWTGFFESELRLIESASPFLDSSESVETRREELRKEFASVVETLGVAISAVGEMEEPSDLVRETLGELARKMGSGMYARWRAEEGMDLTLHMRGLWFFRTSSLLRYFMALDMDGWRAFLDSVQDRSDEVPDPWNLYAAVYEEVYGTSPLPSVN